MAVTTQAAVFWDMMSFTSAQVSQRYDVIYRCTSESQKPAVSFNLIRMTAKNSLYFYQAKWHHIPKDGHSGILGEDYTKVSQFLSELLTVVFLLSKQ